MSGWLEFIEEDINCPHCSNRITIQFCEEGNPNRDPVVITGLAGLVNCSKCGKKIEDEDIKDK